MSASGPILRLGKARTLSGLRLNVNFTEHPRIEPERLRLLDLDLPGGGMQRIHQSPNVRFCQIAAWLCRLTLYQLKMP
jgi:hypothetical protein